MSENIIERFAKHRGQIDIEKLKKTHVHYCTPCYGGQVTEPFFRSWSRTHMMFTKYQVPYSVTTSANESLVSRARCHMVAYMMANPEATHLMFIDADINFDCLDIMHMIQHDKDIVVGAYPKKDLYWKQIIKAANEEGVTDEEMIKRFGANYALNFRWTEREDGTRSVRESDGLIELKDAATGFMLIKRSVFEKMINAYPDLYFKNDLNLDKEFEKWTYLFFDVMHEQDTKRYLSEDYAFCRRWQALGGQVWLDPLVKLDHVGHFTFQGDVGSMFKTLE